MNILAQADGEEPLVGIYELWRVYLVCWINMCTPCSSLLESSMYIIGEDPLKRTAECTLIYPTYQVSNLVGYSSGTDHRA